LLVSLWEETQAAIYDLQSQKLQLGMHPEGVSTYYSAGFTADDAAVITRFSEKHSLPQPYNSRVFKSVENGKTSYHIKYASAEKGGDKSSPDLPIGTHEFEGYTVEVSRGDYSPFMARIVAGLRAASIYASSATQESMLARYADSFTTGSIAAHMDGSRFWVKDKGPAVETYMGFIESYRDPIGTRGEWEGFVAIVNKVTSAKFGKLVRCLVMGLFSYNNLIISFVIRLHHVFDNQLLLIAGGCGV
jgi:dipeptidyl-peptidase-3